MTYAEAMKDVHAEAEAAVAAWQKVLDNPRATQAERRAALDRVKAAHAACQARFVEFCQD